MVGNWRIFSVVLVQKFVSSSILHAFLHGPCTNSRLDLCHKPYDMPEIENDMVYDTVFKVLHTAYEMALQEMLSLNKFINKYFILS